MKYPSVWMHQGTCAKEGQTKVFDIQEIPLAWFFKRRTWTLFTVQWLSKWDINTIYSSFVKYIIKKKSIYKLSPLPQGKTDFISTKTQSTLVGDRKYFIRQKTLIFIILPTLASKLSHLVFLFASHAGLDKWLELAYLPLRILSEKIEQTDRSICFTSCMFYIPNAENLLLINQMGGRGNQDACHFHKGAVFTSVSSYIRRYILFPIITVEIFESNIFVAKKSNVCSFLGFFSTSVHLVNCKQIYLKIS